MPNVFKVRKWHGFTLVDTSPSPASENHRRGSTTMRRVREDYARVVVGARVVVLWHAREKEGEVFYRTRGTGTLHVRLLDNNSTPQVPLERYVCTLVPEDAGRDPGAAGADVDLMAGG